MAIADGHGIVDGQGIADGQGLPIAVYVASASPHEAKLVEPTVQSCCARDRRND